MKGFDEKEKGRSLRDEELSDELRLEQDTFKAEEGRRTKDKNKGATEMLGT